TARHAIPSQDGQRAPFANFLNFPPVAGLQNSTSHFAGVASRPGLLYRLILPSLPRVARHEVYANFRNFPSALKFRNLTSQLAGFASRHNLAFQYLLPKK